MRKYNTEPTLQGTFKQKIAISRSGGTPLKGRWPDSTAGIKSKLKINWLIQPHGVPGTVLGTRTAKLDRQSPGSPGERQPRNVS